MCKFANVGNPISWRETYVHGDDPNFMVAWPAGFSKKTKTIAKKNNVWFVQFGVYSKKESANILKESLIEDGLSGIQVSQVMNRGKMIYYVRGINVKSYALVQKQANKLKKKDIDFIFLSNISNRMCTYNA